MLHESQRLASLVEQNPDAVFCLDLDGTFTDVNPAGERISGRTRAALIGTNFAELLDPEDVEHGMSLFLKATHGETLAHETFRIRHADGHLVHIGVSAFPWMLGGRMMGLVGIARDITNRVREREELKASRLRYKSLIDASPNAIVVHEERRIIFVNGAACTLVGAEGPEELVGRNVMDFVPPDARDAVRARIRKVLETGSAPIVEERIVALDGSIRHVELGAACISYEDRPAIQLVIRDVSDIRRSEGLLRQITENVREIFYLTRLDPVRPEYVSPAFEDIVGCSLRAVLDDPKIWWSLIHPSDSSRVKRTHAAKQGKESYELEYRIVRPVDGTLRWLHERTFPVRDEQGTPVSVVGIIEDVTERKLLEEQLFQAQKMESIGRLAGGVAHDFNNLLMVILNAARFVEEEIGPESPARDDIAQVVSAAERGAKLVRQLLTYSRRQLVAPKVVNVNDVIGEMRDLVQRTIGEDIALLTTLREHAWLTKIDPNQLSQIVLNLALNARDAMPRGGTLAIETRNTFVDEDFALRHPDMQPGPYVILSISDTGTGIPRDIVDMIFEPFFSTKSKAEATGLGLSMVYGIVTQAGGHVSVYTEQGIGTTFNVYLKAADREAVVPEANGDPVRPGRGEKVLVAEDDPAVLEATVRMLSRNGYEVIQASSGEKALEVVKERDEVPDLVLADVIMPRMSGRELASHLRVTAPDTKIIFMSGYTSDMIGRHGVLGSDDNYIQKPFTADELLRKIGDVL